MRLKDKVAVVTGGGSGIGRAICLLFAQEGAKVAVNDINEDGIAETITQMGEASANALPLQGDVSSSTTVKQMFENVMVRYGTVDILVNNAGIGETSGGPRQEEIFRRIEQQVAEAMGGEPITSFLEVTQSLTDEEWDRMLRVHLYGTFYCTREALKIMEAKRYGRIVNMASVAATLGIEGAPHYSAAKAGIVGFSRSVAREIAARGININVIAPGYIETPMTEVLSPVVQQIWTMNTPMKRPGQALEVANVALYLASDESSYVTGQVISPSGGMWMS